jgi:hypothetical protein
MIEYSLHPVVDRPMRRGGPTFRRKQGQHFFDTLRLIGVGFRCETADSQQAEKNNSNDYACCEMRMHPVKTFSPGVSGIGVLYP